MTSYPSSAVIYDMIRSRGVAIRNFSLSVTDRAVVIRGEIRSYYQMQLCLSVVSSRFEGREIVNNLVVHSDDFNQSHANAPARG